MSIEWKGKALPPSLRVGIAVSRYNESITGKLLSAAKTELARGGIAEGDLHIAWTPGAFELPTVAHALAMTGRYAAVICLGAVIRGDTTHDQHINRAVSLGLVEASIKTGVPILFGVLTCDTLEQAIQRSGGTLGNKGAECATAALEMISLLQQIAQPGEKV